MNFYLKRLAILGLSALLFAGAVSDVFATYGNLDVGGDCEVAWAELTPIPDTNVEIATLNGQDTLYLELPWNGDTQKTFDAYIKWNDGRQWSESKDAYKPQEDCQEPSPTPTPSSTPTPTPTDELARCTGLEANPSEGTASLYVKFAAAGYDSQGDIKEYKFDFGDNSDNQPQRINNVHPEGIHVYHNPGTYTAKVEVLDSRGVWHGGNSECETEITVKDSPQPQVASASTELPETGPPIGQIALAGLSLAGLGIGLFRRFRLV